MLIVVYFQISPTLILHRIEKDVSMHIYVRLLVEKSLTIASESIHKGIVELHHLLLPKLVALLLKILNPFEWGLSDRQIFSRPDMQINFNLIYFGFSLNPVADVRSELSFLCEEILEEDDQRRLHLLEDILVNNLFSDFIPNIGSPCSTRHPFERFYFSQYLSYSFEHLLGLVLE